MKSRLKKSLNTWLFAIAAIAAPSLQAESSFSSSSHHINPLELFPDFIINPDAPLVDFSSLQSIIGQTLVELFEQESIYAHSADLAIINGAPIASINAINARLTQNAQDIATFLAQFFPLVSPQIFSQLAVDLAEYVVFEEAFTTALVAGDIPLAQQLLIQWQAQGQDIANILSSLNPAFLSHAELSALFNQHTQTEAFQIANYILGNYTTGIQLYDQSRAQLMQIGAYVARGVDAALGLEIGGSHSSSNPIENLLDDING